MNIWVTVLRYGLLVVTAIALLAAFLVLNSAWGDALGAAYAGSSGVSAAYARSLFEKLFAIVAGIGFVVAIILSGWYYGRSRAAAELLRRFARTSSIILLLVGACHGLAWILGGPNRFTLLLAVAECCLGGALVVLSLRRRKRS
jgi:hypothetical protein